MTSMISLYTYQNDKNNAFMTSMHKRTALIKLSFNYLEKFESYENISVICIMKISKIYSKYFLEAFKRAKTYAIII